MRKLAFSLLLAAFATPAMAEADFHDFEVKWIQVGNAGARINTPFKKGLCLW